MRSDDPERREPNGPSRSSLALPRAAAVAAVVSASLASYWPVLFNGFVEFDDGLYVVRNAHVRGGLSWDGLRWALSLPRSTETYWHPLTWLSLMLDVEVFGVSPGAIHAVSLALHVAGAVLLFAALTRMTGSAGRSAAVALLFAVHPLNVESVAWVAERKTVLAGCFGFAALWSYAWYAERPSVRRYAAVLSLFALSLLAKPMMLALPFLLLLLDVWPLGRTRWLPPERPRPGAPRASVGLLVAEKGPLLAVAAAVCFALVVRGVAPVYEEVSPALRLSTAVTNYWRYAWNVAWPAKLAVFYPQVFEIAAWKVLAAAAALACTTLLWIRPRLLPGPLVGWLWFLGTMIPMAGLVRNGLWPGMADRFMYFPLVGLLILGVWGAALLLQHARHGRVVGVVLVAAALLAAGARTLHYVGQWRDSETLFRAAVENTGGSTIARTNLGRALEAKGRLAEARAVYEEIVRVSPGAPDGYVNLGKMLHVAGDLDGAEAQYGRALQISPALGEALYDMALVQKQRGRAERALDLFERAVRAGFTEPDAWNQLGAGYGAAGRPRDAEAAFRETLARDPDHWRARVNLAALLHARRRTQEAAAMLTEARILAVRAGDDPGPVDAALRMLARGAQ